MTKKTIIFTISILLILTGGYGFYQFNKYKNRTTPPEQPGKLKQVIVNNLKTPFPNSDTVVLETMWGFCGNTPSDQLPIVFDTELDKENNVQLISQNFGQTVIPMDSFQVILNEIRKNEYNDEYIPNLWDSVTKTIVDMTVHAEKVNSRQVITHETYILKNESKIIIKDFRLENNSWTYSITDTLTFINE